ncbi:MAG: glycosyltransferase family 25 protein [Pasteurella oralis]|uniref:glycosyltransferase family 25 protein n=1 Tax=Pasteurella oralis TaxID=1071947 RepID=UPI00270683D6|nr:glycosyltransferase family 25 protein [Pasteurella oralis]
MKKYLISLEKDQHRRELFFQQENTQDFEIFSAINTMSIEPQELSQQFNAEKFAQHYGRKVTSGEIGCTLSHLAVYQKIVDDNEISENEYSLICEDDALFNHHFQHNLEKLLAQGLSADIVLVGQSKIADFNDVELEINYPTTFSFLLNKIEKCDFTVSYPYKNYFAGTVAYLIKKSAAKKLLSACQDPTYWLADDFILFGSQFGLVIQVVRPLMAIENPSLNSNLAAVRGELSNNLVKKLMKYPLKKVLAVKRNLGKV